MDPSIAPPPPPPPQPSSSSSAFTSPPRAKSEGPASASFHSGPMDDPDPSARKRPRLDSGESIAHRRSMSADRIRSPGMRDGLAGTTSVAVPESKSAPTAAHPSTPTKVTINVKEPLPEDHKAASSAPDVPAVSSTHDTTAIPAKAGTSKSPHSSNASSPEIQVAEVEDITQEPAITRWRTIKSDIDEARRTQATMLKAFPYNLPTRTLPKTIQVIATALEKHDLQDGQALERLADWIDHYLHSTEHLSSYWPDLYLEEKDTFWNELPAILEGLYRRSESTRHLIQMEPSDDMTGESNPLTRFLDAWTGLALRMLEIDRATLMNSKSCSPDLISDRYLALLPQIFRSEAAFLKHVVDGPDYLPEVSAHVMVPRFCLPPSSGMQTLTAVASSMLDNLGDLLPVMSRFTPIFWIASSLATYYHSVQGDSLRLECLEFLPHQLYEYYKAVDMRLQHLISKQAAGLSLNLCQNLITSLATIIWTLSFHGLPLDGNITAFKDTDMAGLPQEERADLLQLCWKFETLKKCIMEGRMEIRVQGVDTMQQELLSNHKKFVEGRPDPCEHPISRFISNFLIQNKIVQYLVGPESHPQLIHRSSNIVGFLIVTRRFTTADMDVVWNAIATSQESRSGEILLSMLSHCFNLCNYSILLHLVRKLSEAPIEDFDAKLLTFSSAALRHLKARWEEESRETDQAMDLAPIDFCIRLIRQSAPDSGKAIENRRAIHDLAKYYLHDLLSRGPRPQARDVNFEECLKNIGDPAAAATTGDVSAIIALISSDEENLIKQLTSRFGMTDILIDEFIRYVDMAAKEENVSTAQPLHECLRTRMHLISYILLFAPETLSREAATTFWDASVGARSISDLARSMAWQFYADLTKHSISKRNPFIDLCIADLLPHLDPKYLVSGSLSFAKDVTGYLEKTASLRSDGEDYKGLTAAELMWHLALVIPPQTDGMEKTAISMLVQLYLDSSDAHQRSREANDSLHVQLVDRCIKHLTSAAAKMTAPTDDSVVEDDSMVLVADPKLEKQTFLRSLMILDDFVRGVRSRAMYSPSPPAPATLPNDFTNIQGAPVTIKYQAFSEAKEMGQINTFEVGSAETVESFAKKIALLTGFPRFTAIAGGQKLDLASLKDHTMGEVDISRKGLLLIRRLPSKEPLSSSSSTLAGLRPMEIEVLRHFDELYSLLGIDEALSRPIYEFLTAFPPHDSIVELVKSDVVTNEQLFPLNAPLKIQYDLFVMKHLLSHRLQMALPSAAFIKSSIQRLIETFNSLYLTNATYPLDMKMKVAQGLLDCLVSFFKIDREPTSTNSGQKKEAVSIDSEKVEPSTTENATAMPPAEPFVTHCFKMLRDVSAMEKSVDTEKISICTLQVLLEASLLSPPTWDVIKVSSELPWALRWFLIDSWDVPSRQLALKTIKSYYQLNAESLPEDFVLTLTKIVMDQIPLIDRVKDTTEQFFEFINFSLGSLPTPDRVKLEPARRLRDWSRILMGHHHHEVVGRAEVDYFLLGLARLLAFALVFNQAQGTTTDLQPSFMEDILFKFLFPRLDDTTASMVLDSATREQLYNILIALVTNEEEYYKLLALTEKLFQSPAEGPQASTWGIAQTLEDNSYEPNWSVERKGTIRAAVGYPGLRNLSNTCYMNSLFCQLFMNIDFRRFILNANVADGGASQRLLREVQTLFAFMQESYLKSIDTQSVAESIVTYDNTPVDVNIQVDVDEFFNLLFDRLESQILTDKDKHEFRGIYGGQLVQQIKSKECEHVSERLEPFSAIQCDISGKRTLVESLNAYVQGEAMEGDNKYSCTSCGRYVDAVKRACLKEIPNNMIFHLKRFDYDLMHGTRTKINERFEFPMEVDMSPYKVEYLAEPDKTPTADVFVLVGVLVHSGTAESGHYYSYIQDRSSTDGPVKTWIESNDQDVSDFNPAEIDAQCFGGWTDMPGYESTYPKLWNAYMLFYERKGASQAQVSTKCHIPPDLQARINGYNQTFLRQFALFDPVHTDFVVNLLRKLRAIHQPCSQGHFLEAQTYELVLEYLNKILAHVKETTRFDETLKALRQSYFACPACCRIVLRWVENDTHPVQDLLLRCPHPLIRKDFASMVCLTLVQLKQYAPSEYGFVSPVVDEALPEQVGGEMSPLQGALIGVVSRLFHFWDSIHLSSRAWDDYFGLLADLASIGPYETYCLLNQGFLQRCLEFLLCDHPVGRPLRTRNPYAGYIRLLERGRKYSFNKLVELIAIFFEKIDFQEPPQDDIYADRVFHPTRMPLSEIEYSYIHVKVPGNKSTCIFLDRVLKIGNNPQATRRIIKSMVLADPEANFSATVLLTIKPGLEIDPAHLAAPYLRAAITFLECTHSSILAERLIADIATGVDSIGQTGGREHLQFFTSLRRLRSFRSSIEPAFFERCALSTAHLWAPQLLMYWEEDVRHETRHLLHLLLFAHDIYELDDEQRADKLMLAGRKLCIACSKRCEMVLEEGKPVGRMADVVVGVIAECLARYFVDEDADFVREAGDVAERMRVLAVADPDDQASVEWANASDDAPSDSESGVEMGSP